MTTTETEIVEKVARAIANARSHNGTLLSDELNDRELENAVRAAIAAMPDSTQLLQTMAGADGDVVRDISGETVCGFRVAAYRETHPEHGDKYGHSYSEHWSTSSTRDPRVKVERLFTEDQLRAALAQFRAQEQPK